MANEYNERWFDEYPPQYDLNYRPSSWLEQVGNWEVLAGLLIALGYLAFLLMALVVAPIVIALIGLLSRGWSILRTRA